MSRPFGPSDQQLAAVDQILYSGSVRYRNPGRVREDAVSVSSQMPSLIPRSGIMPAPNINSFQQALLFLGGTIPVQYKGNTYNIPVSIWFPESYPIEAPIAFVNPTQTMTVTPGHPNVDDSGRVRLPYLDNWADPRQGSHILVLLTVIMQAFSQNPPLRTRPQGPIPGTAVMGSAMGAAMPTSPPPPYTQHGLVSSVSSSPYQPQQSPSPYNPQQYGYPPQQPSYPPQQPTTSSFIMSGQPNASGIRPVHPQSVPVVMQPQQLQSSQPQRQPQSLQSPPPPYNPAVTSPPQRGGYPGAPQQPLQSLQPMQPMQPMQPQQPVQQPPTAIDLSAFMPPKYPEDPKVFADRQAKANLIALVEKRMKEMQQQMSEEVEKLMLESSNLEETSKILDQSKQAALVEREQLHGALNVLGKQSADLQQWLDQHEQNGEQEPNIDDLTDPTDPLLKQLFALRAEDAAIEDFQYWLDKALRANRVDVQTFLKTTRSNASDQFMKRALMKKIQDIVGIRSPNNM